MHTHMHMYTQLCMVVRIHMDEQTIGFSLDGHSMTWVRSDVLGYVGSSFLPLTAGPYVQFHTVFGNNCRCPSMMGLQSPSPLTLALSLPLPFVPGHRHRTRSRSSWPLIRLVRFPTFTLLAMWHVNLHCGTVAWTPQQSRTHGAPCQLEWQAPQATRLIVLLATTPSESTISHRQNWARAVSSGPSAMV